ncbi:MAG: hypothetical protein RIC07_07860 [Coleofasciculus sp. E1-EBD-02]
MSLVIELDKVTHWQTEAPFLPIILRDGWYQPDAGVLSLGALADMT